MNSLTFIDIYAGIGGFSLGFERAGMKCVGQVELDPYCRAVLASHWPHLPRHDDVRTFTDETFAIAPPDVLCGGFPCQNISNAGDKTGIDGEQSRIWNEFCRLVCLFRPAFAVVENVAALLVRGIDRVLGDLARIGMDAEWSVLPCCALGFPHTRRRLFIVAYPVQSRRARVFGSHARRQWEEWVTNPTCGPSEENHRQWGRSSEFLRSAHGLPNRVDRVASLGNAVVPQVAEFIGRAIIQASRA